MKTTFLTSHIDTNRIRKGEMKGLGARVENERATAQQVPRRGGMVTTARGQGDGTRLLKVGNYKSWVVIQKSTVQANFPEGKKAPTNPRKG